VATTEKNIMTADGKDATIVNISIVDDKGREVPVADNMVKFFLTVMLKSLA
jgi:beta-galactosidase